MLKLLLTLFTTTLANATSITVTVQNAATGPTPVAVTTGPVIGLTTFFPGQTSGGVISAFMPDANTYEFAANDVSALRADTLNLFATFAGITSPTGQIELPSILLVDEYANPGWTLSEQVLVNGLIVGTRTQTSLVTEHATFTADVSSPYTITLQLQFVSDGVHAGDYGSAVLASPSSNPVPAPIAGAGLPGLLLILAACAKALRSRLRAGLPGLPARRPVQARAQARPPA